MDQATVSSWKLLPWSILGGSNKKTRIDRSPKKVSAFKRRLQAHAAIARSLSPVCARTSFNSPAMPEEENKCILSLSVFMNACSRCTFRDVQVPLAHVHSPHQQKAYIKAIHHHLEEPSLQHLTKTPSSRRAHHKASFGGAFHTEKSRTSREGYSMHQKDHHHRHMTPPKKGDAKKTEAYKCNEIEIKPSKQDKPHQLKQCREGEVIARGKSRPKKHGKSRHKLEVYSFDTSDSNPIEHLHHCTPTTSLSSRKGIHRPKDPSLNGCDNDPIVHASHGTKASSVSSKKSASQSETHHRKGSSVTRKAAQIPHNLDADLYVCTTTHVLEQHKGTEPPLKSKHSFVAKSLETWQASEDAQLLRESKSHKSDAVKEKAHQHASKDPALSSLSLKDHHESKEWFASKDPLSLKCSESYGNKDPLMSFKSGDSFANKDPLALNGSEFYVNKDPLSLKSSGSYVNKDLSSKISPSPVYKDNQGDNNATKASEKIRLVRLDHDKVSDGIWMQDTLPVVKYSHNPYRDFHNSMLEMLLGRGLKNLHELQDMFVCYVLLNSPHNQKHIEKAFRDLLTDLYKCKLMKSLQVEEMQHAKTEGLSSH